MPTKVKFRLGRNEFIRMAGLAMIIFGSIQHPWLHNSAYEFMGAKFESNGIQLLGTAIVFLPILLKYLSHRQGPQ